MKANYSGVIRYSQRGYVAITLIATLVALNVFWIPKGGISFFEEEKEFAVLFLFIASVSMGYSLFKLIFSKPGLIISSEGIYIDKLGFFKWIDMVSFWTTRLIDTENGNKDTIYFVYMHKRIFEFDPAGLEKDLFEITQMIIRVSSIHDVKFLGYLETKED